MAYEPSEIPESGGERTRLLRISAGFGLLGVALGAFGAHGLEKVLDDPSRLATWDTAVLYHLLHSVMLYVIAVTGVLRRGAWMFMAIGIVIFSGSLYALVLSGITLLGAITPIGGVCLLIGWSFLIARPAR